MATVQTLVITVKGRQAAQFGSRSQKVFAGSGGSIGRSEDCDWVLSAAGVSRVHAIIRYLNGMYFIEDASTNGMLLNGVALVRGDPASLKEGDCLQIDTFEMAVNIQSGNDALPPTEYPAPESDLSDLLPGSGGVARKPSSENLIPDEEHQGLAADLDPLSFLEAPLGSGRALPGGSDDAPLANWNHSPGMEDHFHPPRMVSPTIPALPEDWDMTKGDFSSKAAAPTPAPLPPVSPIAPVAAEATPPLPPDVAEMLRVVADGLMEVLRTRAEIKMNFRLPVTIVQRSENNPLKFAVTAEEAVQKIMAAPNAAFLSGPTAFEDAFDDIRCHQMAMLAGIRAGFDALLAHFAPERLEREADGNGKRSAFSGKGRYWERYTEHFQSLMKDPDDCFRRLFGDEFARAYEVQLAQLKSARKAAR
ncbi:type VI secretion system-associated FHA domain protein TagH [Acidithiobacillus ferrivorans]|uniref:Type VI secretion system-associated FHA domain protein TagH n=1 Tax=Acidithiobacillus ferrivorans TaxID=160808 RepID=A0A7T4WFH7_9PROT|nr:type VI secretion system-associated FHA domain protein TagH [Acidithiobacillus ferrivorans]QQD73649.1 type VI secretion system-associated FHA domain protein TagH [Acidithiobacillus ferrivorans]